MYSGWHSISPNFIIFANVFSFYTSHGISHHTQHYEYSEWVVWVAFIRGISEYGGSYDREKPARLYCAGSPTRLDERG